MPANPFYDEMLERLERSLRPLPEEEETNDIKAADALRLLCLIERHGWNIAQRSDGVLVFTWPDTDGGHFAPTLIEALRAAANCKRCCGRES